MPATVTLRPRRIDAETLELAERIGQRSRADSLQVEDGAVVLVYDNRDAASARVDAHMACLLELG